MDDAEQEDKLEGDPGVRIRKMLAHDMLRNEIYSRTKALAETYERMFNARPGWVRVSFDLVHRDGGPVLKEPCSINGLVFRLALESSNRIEVGNSVLEDQ